MKKGNKMIKQGTFVTADKLETEMFCTVGPQSAKNQHKISGLGIPLSSRKQKMVGRKFLSAAL